jgi:hypothetical protein
MSEVTAIEIPSTSPDGQWKATVLENQQSAILRVSSTDGTTEWIAETITSTDIWGGFEWAIPFTWSQYGHYLYFTHYERTDGCTPEFHGSDLQRLDLQTGEVTELAPKVGYWLALSPDERTLAYLSFEKGLVLRELLTNEERSARPAIYKAYPGVIIFVSHLVWSPDGKTLMFTAGIDPCDMPDFVSTSVIRVDAETLSQIELIRESKEWLTAIEWPDVESVLLKDRDGQHWWMNATTGEITRKEE